MKKIKFKVIGFAIVLILTSLLIIFVCINLAINFHVKKMAIDAIELESKRNLLDLEEQKDEYSAIQVNMLSIEANHKIEAERLYYSREEKNLISYYLEHKKTHQNGIHQVHIKGSDFYILIKENMPHYAKNNTDTLIIYTNVTPLIKLAHNINIIFIMLLFALGTLAYYLGITFGKRIENAQLRLKHFFQNTSHELKTPIMSIQGYADGIKENVIKDHATAADIIIKESERMNVLIEELLYLSKMDSGQIKMKMEKQDVSQILYDTLNVIIPIANKQKIAINPLFDEKDIMTNCDEIQLKKAILNLLSNALKYAKSQIKVVLKQYKNKVHIEVIDDGIGISPKDLPHLFKRFYIGENGNTGIGLALTKEIIEKHGGQICALNTREGTCFKITLDAESASIIS